REVVFEIDQLATKSEKSILCRYGNTTVLTVLTIKQLAKEVNSFFPLTINFEEKFYAVGKIPNAFGKREGKPSHDAITAARMIDRSLRSLFPLGSNQEVQISNCVLSLDQECDPPVVIGKEKDNFICNPSSEQLNNSLFELIVSATEEKITMLDGAAQEISEKELEKAINFAQKEILVLIGFFRHIASVLEVKKEPMITKEIDLDIQQNETKQVRLDGRRVGEIRPLKINIDYLPNVHGSAVFERGETKVLAVVTIGKISDKQLVDSIFSRYHKYFIHHYNFPQFAVNEVASYRGVSRREVGHGELVEKTFDYLLPEVSNFPYTIRVVSEVFSSDGSSSQASVCAASLALMTAGVPLVRPAAGIALGLFEGQIYTDLNGLEDKLGEMDFKIAGTEKGICSLQLDVKNNGISSKLLRESLEKARQARLYILSEMKHLILHPRSTLPTQVIKCRSFYVEKEVIGLIIGPRGKTINQLTEETGSTIEIEDDGYVIIYNQEEKKLERTYQAIKENPKEEINKELKGIKRTTGQHPGGLLITLPNTDIQKYTPLNYPADNRQAEWMTTHFEYSFLSEMFLKVDMLGHDEPTILQKLFQLTGIDPEKISFRDEKVMKMFTEADTLGIPEFGTDFVKRNLLTPLKPTKFSQLVQISGFSHGTNV
ncbi:3167_t:CDS:2, partial [Ambispora leptoticha]